MALDDASAPAVWNLEQQLSVTLRKKGLEFLVSRESPGQEDQVFPFVLATLASEAPIEDLPTLASREVVHRSSGNPFRRELASMATDSDGNFIRYVPGTAGSKTLEVIRAKYIQFAGYSPDVTGVALGACDYYFERARDRGAAPIVAAGCISFLSASFRSNIEPEWLRSVHQECADVVESATAGDSTLDSATSRITMLAERWAAAYRVPRV